jgi:hypothetical protein
VVWWISDWAAVRGQPGKVQPVVAGDECFALAGCGESAAGAVGEYPAGIVEDGGQRRAVGGESQRLSDAQRAAVLGGGPAGSALQIGQ